MFVRARAHVLYKSVNECCRCLPNCVFSVVVVLFLTFTPPPEGKDLQTPKKREREGEKTRERDAAPKRADFLWPPKIERETTPRTKKKTQRVEMARFAEAPAGDVAKGTSSPSFFLSLFPCVCVCVCVILFTDVFSPLSLSSKQ